MARLIFFTILISLLLFIQYELFFAKGGLVEVWHSKKKIALELKKNSSLEKRNQKLRKEIIGLKKGGDAIEEQARSEFGMVKRGEVFYRTVKVHSKDKA